MVLADVDEVFVPLREGMFANPSESRYDASSSCGFQVAYVMDGRHIIEALLVELPNRFTETTVYSSALGPALRACLAAFVRPMKTSRRSSF